jgi:enolase
MLMSKISGLDAIEILDSRGNPTIQVTMRLESGAELGANTVYAGNSVYSRWRGKTKAV